MSTAVPTFSCINFHCDCHFAFVQWFDVQAVFGGKWDLYLMTVLAGCVVALLVWRTRG